MRASLCWDGPRSWSKRAHILSLGLVNIQAPGGRLGLRWGRGGISPVPLPASSPAERPVLQPEQGWQSWVQGPATQHG